MAGLLLVGGDEGEIAGRKGLVERRRSGECGADGRRRIVGVVLVAIGFHDRFTSFEGPMRGGRNDCVSIQELSLWNVTRFRVQFSPRRACFKKKRTDVPR